jgi:hypothetical protein
MNKLCKWHNTSGNKFCIDIRKMQNEKKGLVILMHKKRISDTDATARCFEIYVQQF